MMKKKYLFTVVLSVIFSFCSAGDEVFQSSWRPKKYFERIEKKLENYWRVEQAEKVEKNSDIDDLLNFFDNGMHEFADILKLSGLKDIEEISCSSEFCKEDEKEFYSNTIEIDFDEDSKGFLSGLLQELPEHKRYVPKEDEEDISDIYMLTDDTLFAFDIPLNVLAAVKKLPENSSLYKKLSALSERFAGMTLEDLADHLTGEWGGVVSLVREQQKDGERIGIDFMFIIPDPGDVLYKKLGEYFVLRRMAYFKEKILHLPVIGNYPELVVLQADGHLMVLSSLSAGGRFVQTAENEKVCERVKKLNVTEETDDDFFVYWNSEGSALVNSLLTLKELPLNFLADFGGGDVFNHFEADEGSLTVRQYSNISLADMSAQAYAVGIMVHLDNYIFRKVRQNYLSKKIGENRDKCRRDMEKYSSALQEYAAKNGKFPEGINRKGLDKLAAFANIDKEDFALRLNKDKILPYGRFYYWGENSSCRRADIPLLSDRGGVHNKYLHIIFCDGSVQEIPLENVRSARRIVSYLHTVYHYDNATFNMLLKQAERLDSEKL